MVKTKKNTSIDGKNIALRILTHLTDYIENHHGAVRDTDKYRHKTKQTKLCIQNGKSQKLLDQIHFS